MSSLFTNRLCCVTCGIDKQHSDLNSRTSQNCTMEISKTDIVNELKSDHKDTTEEDQKNEEYRIYAAISFAFVLIVLGLPLWWKSTEVYRVPLPYSRIAALDEYDLPLVVNVTIATLDRARGEKIAADFKHYFKTSSLFQILCSVTDIDKQRLADARSIQDLELASFARIKPGHLMLLEVPGLKRFTPGDILVGRRRIVYFSTEATSIKLSEVLRQWLFQENSIDSMVNAMLTPTKTDLDRVGRRRIPASAAYDIMVTVVNPEPEKLNLEWDLTQTIEDFLQPFLKNLAPLADYNVKSQWLYFVHLEVQPKMVADNGDIRRHFALPQDLLPHIITPLEKKLASHVSRNPCLNFVVYVPPCDKAPLHIYWRQGMRVRGGVDAFLSPRWGGIVIHNPPVTLCLNKSVPDPRPMEVDSTAVMGVFLAQLRQLLGISELDDIPNVDVLPLTSSGIRQWELDSLYRVRTLEQLTSAKLTLQSLAELLGEISNIVINDDVGDSIYSAVAAVEHGARLLREGELTKAFVESRKAFLSAEAAFTDPSLLALLYFPDDQKYAVYIPLFLPVMIPVLMSLKNISSWLKKKLSQQPKQKAD